MIQALSLASLISSDDQPGGCRVAGCEREPNWNGTRGNGGRGMCAMHYKRFQRGQELEGGPRHGGRRGKRYWRARLVNACLDVWDADSEDDAAWERAVEALCGAAVEAAPALERARARRAG